MLIFSTKKSSMQDNLAAGGGARPVREALFERWREGKTAAFAPQHVRPSSRNAWPASPLAVARDSEGSMQAWQVLARAGLADGDTAAPQAAAPRPLSNAADVLQLLEDAPIQPPAEPRYRCRRRRVVAGHRFRASHRAQNRLTLQVQHYNASGGPRTADHVMAPPLTRAGKPRGRGSWRKWLPEHISRAAFAAPTASSRAVTGILGGGAHQTVTTCRRFVAQLVEQAQLAGVKRLCRRVYLLPAEDGAQRGPQCRRQDRDCSP